MEGSVASTWKDDADARLSTRRRSVHRLAARPTIRMTSTWRLSLRDLTLLLLLIGLAGSIRAWQLSHTEVAARDSIGFIRTALQFERLPAAEVIRNSQQHPGYPLALLAMSWPVRYFMGGTTPVSMQLSAQLTSALASILLVLPMFFLGRELFDRRAGFWGTALFQCLPVASRVLSDALSEATFLLLITTATLLAVRAIRYTCPVRFALCGVFGGLAYLTRPEGALVVVAAVLVLLGTQAHPLWRRSWRRVLACTGSLTAAALAVGSPYVLITGKLTNKPTGKIVLEMAWFSKDNHAKESGRADWQSGPETVRARQPLAASLFAVYAPEGLKDRRWWGIQAIATEVTRAYQYITVFPVLFGLWWFRDRLRMLPGAWVLLVLCLLHGLVLWRMARVVGYVSDRHVLLLVLCGVFTGTAAVAALGDWLAGRIEKGTSAVASMGPRTWPSMILLIALTLFGLPDDLRTLHVNRAGHRAAGLWLAEHAHPADTILDPYCWAHYYAGQVFQEGIEPEAPAGYHVTYYAVLECSAQEHDRLPTISNAKKLAALGKVVYHWPENKPEESAKIKVYAVTTGG